MEVLLSSLENDLLIEFHVGTQKRPYSKPAKMPKTLVLVLVVVSLDIWFFGGFFCLPPNVDLLKLIRGFLVKVLALRFPPSFQVDPKLRTSTPLQTGT